VNTQCLEIAFNDHRSYRIYIGAGLLAGVGEQIARITQHRAACIITDTNVGPLYLEPVRTGLEEAGFTVSVLEVAAGEQSKDYTVAHELWENLARQGLHRDGLIVALGGGMVGDLAGFVASTYLRGVDCIQIPTTLLAMVDSSVGGKTAINLAAGKNLVGSFAQPLLVVVDLNTLTTLPACEWDNGLAEIAKSALLEGGQLYSWLNEYADDLRKQGKGAVQQAVVRTLAFKGRVVVADEKEAGVRECLNYGHTFAHALENVAGYGTISHGRAVAEGMRFAATLAQEAADVSEAYKIEQNTLLEALGLVEFCDYYPADDLFEAMVSDKKVRNNEMRFVFVTDPGTWKTVVVDVDLLKIHLILWAQARL